MRKIMMALTLASPLGACAALPAGRGDATELLKAANEHIETCERHYQGGLGVGAAFTFRIDCPAVTRAPAPSAEERSGGAADQKRNGAAGQD